jgi:hypothetical protein
MRSPSAPRSASATTRSAMHDDPDIDADQKLLVDLAAVRS